MLLQHALLSKVRRVGLLPHEVPLTVQLILQLCDSNVGCLLYMSCIASGRVDLYSCCVSNHAGLPLRERNVSLSFGSCCMDVGVGGR